MKNEQNQQVKTMGIVMMFALVVTSVLVASPIWNRPFAEETEKTMHRAESLAYQILAARKNQISKVRTPASEGSLNHLEAEEGAIGQDPWGQPYRFKWLRKSSFQSRLLVWSSGPNGQVDTSSENLDSNRDAERANFTGDDVGIMLSIK